MQLLIQQIINGLGLTGPILLVAVALSSGIAASRVINLAVGAIYVLVTVLTLTLLKTWPSWSLLVVMLLGPVVFMLALEFGALRWQRRRSKNAAEVEQSSFALTAALASVLAALTAELTMGQPVGLPAGTLDFTERINVGGITLQLDAIIIFVVALVVALGWTALLRGTRIGKLFRATAADHGLARSLGVRVETVAVTGAVIQGLLLGLAGCMALVRVRVADGESASAFLLLPLAAVLISGLGEVGGAVIASILFGLLYSIVATWAPNPAFQDVAAFGLLFIVLLIKPQGVSLAGLRMRRQRPAPAKGAAR